MGLAPTVTARSFSWSPPADRQDDPQPWSDSYGYRLVTDDIIMYDLATRRYVPMPRSPKIDGDAARYLTDAGLELPSAATGVEPYVVLADKYWQREPMGSAPGRVYFMKRSADLPLIVEAEPIDDGAVGMGAE